MNRRDTLIALALALVLSALLAPYAITGIDPHHDGIMLKPALDVLSGQSLFRDTFNQYGSMSCHLQVMALAVYPSLVSIRLLTLFAYGVSLAFLYLAWRQLMPVSLAVLGCVAFYSYMPAGDYGVFLPWSSVYALAFQSAGLLALAKIVQGEKAERWGLVLGLMTAGVFWCRQPVGVLMGAGLAVICGLLLWKADAAGRGRLLRSAAWVVGGFALVSLAMLLEIVLTGAFSAWWYQNFEWPRKWANEGLGSLYWTKYFDRSIRPQEGGWLALLAAAFVLPGLLSRWLKPWPKIVVMAWSLVLGAVVVWKANASLVLLSPSYGGGTFLIPVLTAVLALQGLLRVLRAGPASAMTGKDGLVLVFGGFAVASLIQYYPVSDPWHVLWAAAPAFGVVLFALWSWSGARKRTAACLLFLCLLPGLVHRLEQSWSSYRQPTVTLDAPSALRGMRATAEQAAVLARVNACVERATRSDPERPGVLFGMDALYLCFLRNKENPIPFYVSWEKLVPPAEDQKRSQYIHDVRPLLFFHQPRREVLKGTFQRIGYLSLGYLPEIDLEIGAPKELLDEPSREAAKAK